MLTGSKRLKKNASTENLASAEDQISVCEDLTVDESAGNEEMEVLKEGEVSGAHSQEFDDLELTVGNPSQIAEDFAA